MMSAWRALTFATSLTLLTGPAVAQDAAPGGFMGGSPPPAATDGTVLAQGAGGTFTRDAADAYIEALEFTLAEIGQPTTFEPGERGQIHEALAAGFADLPVEAQIDLANARPLWTQFRSEWSTLPLQAKQEFAYYILTLAYGEQAAGQALGLSAGDAEEGASDTYRPSVDDMIGNVPGTTDCWGSAGCTGYDAGTGTYTFED
jgi:hypothetical protein